MPWACWYRCASCHQHREGPQTNHDCCDRYFKRDHRSSSRYGRKGSGQLRTYICPISARQANFLYRVNQCQCHRDKSVNQFPAPRDGGKLSGLVQSAYVRLAPPYSPAYHDGRVFTSSSSSRRLAEDARDSEQAATKAADKPAQ